MPGLPILTIFIGVSIVFTLAMRRRSRDYGKEFEDFIVKENEANAAPSRAIEPELLYTPDLSALPVRPDDGGDTPSLKRQREALKRGEKQMVRFDAPMTNTELKLKYGAVRLELVSEYEENFFAFTYALNSWAEALIQEGNDADAEAVLRTGVLAGAETSKTYTLLADLYFKRDKRGEMRELYETVKNKRMPAQEKTWSYINDYYIKMGL